MKKITRTQILLLKVPVPERTEQERVSAGLAFQLSRSRIVNTAIIQEWRDLGTMQSAILQEAFDGKT